MPDAPDRDAQAIELPSLPDGEGVLILMNSEAGKAVIRLDPRPRIAERLPRAVVRVLDEGDSFDDAVRAAVASDGPPRVLGVFGGDGSVSSMADLALRHDLPLLAMPGGTFNHFLRAAGVHDVDAAIQALRTGRGIAATVAELTTPAGTETVLNVTAVGVYAQFLAERTKRRDRLGKWLGGVAAAWQVLRRAERIDVDIDGTSRRVWSVFVGVGHHTTDQLSILRRDTLSDDVLDVRVLDARASALQAVASLSFGRTSTSVLRGLDMLPGEGEISHDTAESVRIALRPADRGATFWVHDGELQRRPPATDGGRAVLSLRVRPRALRVYAPS